MRHIKNFLHYINDIVLAILIVAAAAVIIFWRMQVIYDYPKTVVGNQTVTEESSAGEATADEAPSEQAGQ